MVKERIPTENETVYWADCEKDENDSGLEPTILMKCLQCESSSFFRYCSKCWRKIRPQKKRKLERVPEEEGEGVDLCLFCATRKRNASLIHGRIAHQVRK